MDFLVSSASNLDVLWRRWLWGSSFSQVIPLYFSFSFAALCFYSVFIDVSLWDFLISGSESHVNNFSN